MPPRKQPMKNLVAAFFVGLLFSSIVGTITLRSVFTAFQMRAVLESESRCLGILGTRG